MNVLYITLLAILTYGMGIAIGMGIQGARDASRYEPAICRMQGYDAWDGKYCVTPTQHGEEVRRSVDSIITEAMQEKRP